MPSYKYPVTLQRLAIFRYNDGAMGTVLLVILVLILIPLATGGLLALVLREIHVRHPLPLVEPGYVNAWQRPKPKIQVAEPVDEQEPPAESVTESITDAVAETSTTEATPEPLPAEPTDEMNLLPPAKISVFNNITNIPQDWTASDILDSMTSTVSSDIPNDLEFRIEESTRLKDGLPEDARHIKDDLDLDDLEDLAAALPKSKIDFSQEHELDSGVSEPITPMAKELLGEEFDFAALAQQAKQSTAAITLDVQETAPGLVQISSPFLPADAPQFADFAESQTVFSTFSDDWIQVIEPAEEGTSNFCFTEELQPMFVRKKKA